MMDAYASKVEEAAKTIASRISGGPRIAVITGTGLGRIASALRNGDSLPYSAIPHFPASTVESHIGRLHWGELGGRMVLVLQGRFHLYEGYSPQAVSFPIRVLQSLNVKSLIVSNAAGGLDLSYEPGDIMVIEDHINLTGVNPLTGQNHDMWGIRFPDMSRVYDPDLIRKTLAAGRDLGLEIRKGVYAGLIGPSLETPSETRYLRRIGADAVGFSTIMEVIAAVHAQMRVLGISIITNVNNPDAPQPTTVEAVLAVAEKAAGRLDRVLLKIMEMDDEE